MNRGAVIGAFLVVGTVAVGWRLSGTGALPGITASALLAWLVHVMAAVRLRRVLEAERSGLGGAGLKRVAGAFAFGMGLRLLGIGLVLGAVLTDWTWFEAAPSLIAYGAVLVPLLFVEMRFLK